MKLARDLMSHPVITVTPETSLQELAHIFAENRISGAPVVDADGRLLGMVTETDLLYTEKPLHIPTFVTIFDSLLFFENPFKLDQELKRLTASKVADIYSRDCLTVPATTPAGEIAALMVKEKKYLLPVLDEHGNLAGIVSRADLLTLIS